MKVVLFFLTLHFCYLGHSQQKHLISFDFQLGIYDTLPLISFDSTINNEKTQFNSRNNLIEVLPQSLPTANTYPNSQFTKKSKVDHAFNTNNFPLSSVIKIFEVDSNQLFGNCSGIMISKKHVLTATHCFSDRSTLTINRDSIFVCPSYNNGIQNANFSCSYAKKVFFFENWNLNSCDLAILELEDTIGAQTGWMGIGFENSNINLTNGVFYKFSYPSIYLPPIDSNVYNGDTMYYGYGEVTIANLNQIGIQSASGIPGESGSSLIKLVNNQDYTSYGVLSFSNNLMHSRINNWRYFSIKHLIYDTLINNINQLNTNQFKLYPNPAKDQIFIDLKDSNPILESIKIYNSNGALIKHLKSFNSQSPINISSLTKGIYFISIQTAQSFFSMKFVKGLDIE